MDHLTTDQLIDLAEGAAQESSVLHLDGCDACRLQLAELRTAMSAAAAVDVPEPSPLFWDHLSARVHDAVQAEQNADLRPIAGLRGVVGAPVAWLRLRSVWLAAVVVLVAAAGLLTQVNHRTSTSTPPATTGVIAEGPKDVTASADDPSLALVADLADDLDWESAGEAGLTTHVGVDNDAVNQLTEGERRELRQLLQGELSPIRRGA